MTAPINVRHGRIDYVRMTRRANSTEAQAVWKAQDEALLLRVQGRYPDLAGGMRNGLAYDGRGNWVVTTDVWGPLAHGWLFTMPWEEFIYINRIDVRHESDTSLSSQQLDVIYETARGLNTRSRNLDRKHARPRQKAEGRDAGGDLFACGSLKSDKYLAVYTKPHERTAFELKLSGEALARVLADAQLAAPANEFVGDPDAMPQLVLLRLQAALWAHTLDVTGNRPDEWADYFLRQELSQSEAADLPPLDRVVRDFLGLAPEDRERAIEQIQALRFRKIGEPS